MLIICMYYICHVRTTHESQYMTFRLYKYQMERVRLATRDIVVTVSAVLVFKIGIAKYKYFCLREIAVLSYKKEHTHLKNIN